MELCYIILNKKMYLHICTNERHKCCILSMQQSEMLLCSKFRIFYPGFCNLPSSLRGRLYFTGITNSHIDFKQQTIVDGQYFNVPKPTEFWVDHIKLTQRFGSCMVKDPPSDWVLQLFVG